MPESKPDAARLCLFGGTFDPIHRAHLQIAQAARERFGLDKVLFIPAGTPPHKAGQRVTAYKDRLRMVEIACRPYPAFEVSRLEDRPGRSYTIDTVRRFRATMPEGARLFFLIGADAFRELKTWKEWGALLGLIEFIVVARPGETYDIPGGAIVHRLDGIELAISSSDIRTRIATGGDAPEVPAAVRAFIEERGLYRSREEDATALR